MQNKVPDLDSIIEKSLNDSSKLKILGKTFNMPDIFIILLSVLIIASISTYIIPTGSFKVDKKIVFENGQKSEQIKLDPNSFEYSKDKNGNSIKTKAPLFTDYFTNPQVGIFNSVFEGFVDGGKEGSAGLIAFILIIGGAFGVVLKTGTIETGILYLMNKHQNKESFILAILFFLFSLGGAIFGMGEEAMAFSMITVPLFIGLGYDTFTAMMVTFVSTQIGFGTSWMNPFSIAIAQGLAGLPLLSGAWFRIIMWITFTFFGIFYTLNYAKKIKKNPKLSFCFESDEKIRKRLSNEKSNINSRKFSIGDFLVLLSIFLTVSWVLYGVLVKRWYIGQMSSQFFVMGMVIGLIGVLFKLNNMSINDIATSFMNGVKDLSMCAILIGLCRGIILVIGGTANDIPTILNTLLFWIGNLISGLPTILSGIFMYIFQTLINFTLSASIAQATLTMPLMASLSDILGLSRQVACIAFQLGDAFTNVINPLCPIPLVILAISGVDFVKWFKWQIKFQAYLFAMGCLSIVIAILINF